MEPEDDPVTRHEGGTGQLEDIAVLLEGPFQADGATCGFRSGATAATFGSRKQDVPPAGALEAHGAIALALRVGDAESLDAVAAAEPGHFFRSSLHHAADADAAPLEFRKGLAQLRKRLGVEGSAEVAQPEDQSGSRGPAFREALRLAGGILERKIRQGIANTWSRRWREAHRIALHPSARGVKCQQAVSAGSLSPCASTVGGIG